MAENDSQCIIRISIEDYHRLKLPVCGIALISDSAISEVQHKQVLDSLDGLYTSEYKNITLDSLTDVMKSIETHRVDSAFRLSVIMAFTLLLNMISWKILIISLRKRMFIAHMIGIPYVRQLLWLLLVCIGLGILAFLIGSGCGYLVFSLLIEEPLSISWSPAFVWISFGAYMFSFILYTAYCLIRNHLSIRRGEITP